MKNLLVIILCILYLAGCAELMTAMSDRSFIKEMKADTDGFWNAGQDFEVISGDSGKQFRSSRDIFKRTPQTFRNKQEMLHYGSLLEELQEKENNLAYFSPKEFSKYEQIDHKFSNISERIYYLSLPARKRKVYFDEEDNFEVRQKRNTAIRQVRSNGFRKRGQNLQPNKENDPFSIIGILREQNEQLFMGMQKSSVLRSWGRPGRVDVAGRAENQNERWTFYGPEGVKRVYFERGKVNGWELNE